MAPHASPSSDDLFATIGDLYTRWTLDGLTEIGHAVATDFVMRPQLYQGDDIPETIVDLRVSYGTSRNAPNLSQRQTMTAPILGRSDGLRPDATNASSAFHIARKKVVDAAVSFSERAVDTGLAMLTERVRSCLIPLRAHFEGLRGKSLQLTAAQIKAESTTVIEVLTSPAIARVFGVGAAGKGWPLRSSDTNGAKLVETASHALPVSPDYRMGYTKFILLQRVAMEGGRALSALGNETASETDLLEVISQLYSWGASLRDLQQSG